VLEIFDIVSATDLPQASQSRLYTEPAAMGEIMETFNFIDGQRARADQAHFPAQNVIELRPLIDAEFAHEFAKRGDPWVIGELEDRATYFVYGRQFMFELLGVGEHGAEFVEGKGMTIQARPFLPEKDRTGRSDFDYERKKQKEWGKQYQGN